MSKIDSATFILNRHDFDTTYVSIFNASTSANGTIIITPKTGNQLQIVGIQVDTTATSGTIQFKFATSAKTVAKFYASSTSPTQLVGVVTKTGALNEGLTMISSLGATEYTVTVNYKQFMN